MDNTAKIVRELREALKLSQALFARRLGTTQAMVARWETSQLPTEEWLKKLIALSDELGFAHKAAELEGVMQFNRVGPKIEIRTREESDEVNAVLRILRRKDQYKA